VWGGGGDFRCSVDMSADGATITIGSNKFDNSTGSELPRPSYSKLASLLPMSLVEESKVGQTKTIITGLVLVIVLLLLLLRMIALNLRWNTTRIKS